MDFLNHAAPQETHLCQDTPEERDVEEILWNYIDQQAKEAPAQAIQEEGEG